MLVSTAQASEILGISVQGVHYRIKKGLLKSQKQDGKTFVYIDKNLKKNTPNTTFTNNDELIKAKEEQIELLKEQMLWMKDQFTSEIGRLELNQDKIIEVFKSEILLLQQAYNEMQTLLKVEHKNTQTTKPDENENEMKFMNIKEFFIFMQAHNKNKSQIKAMILNQIKNNDKRFIYKAKNKEVLIYKSDFLDLI